MPSGPLPVSWMVLSLQCHLSPLTPWKPWSVVFLHCMVSVIWVLIFVKIVCNSIFLCTAFFLCELSLFFSFSFLSFSFPPPPFFLVNIYFFFFKKQTNWCVVDLYVTYSLGSYYRYVIRMDILLGFRMFYKKTNS